MNAKQMIRQGDVLLIPIDDSMPVTPRASRVGKMSRHGKLVLAEGETSLHEHTVEENTAELVQQGEKILLSIFGSTTLSVTHTETGEPLPRHTPIRIGPGLYEVRTQRRAEVTPAGMPQRWSRVRD
jgi:hypothetical protein